MKLQSLRTLSMQAFVVLLTTPLTACATAVAPSTGVNGQSSYSNGSGVRGAVQVVPSCPGPQKINTEPCSSPLAAVTLTLLRADGQVASKTTSATDGTFSMAAGAGTYTLHVEVEGMYPRCPEVKVKVKKATVTDAQVICDSGMR